MDQDQKTEDRNGSNHVTRNVLLILAGILAVCLLIFFGVGETMDGHYAYMTAFFLAVCAFLLLGILVGTLLYYGPLQREGKVIYTITFIFLGILLLLWLSAMV